MTSVNERSGALSTRRSAALLMAVQQGAIKAGELRRLAEKLEGQFARMKAVKASVASLRSAQMIVNGVEGSVEIARDLTAQVSELAGASDAVEAGVTPAKTAKEMAAEFVATERWQPGETEWQRGRAALLEEFGKPHNLTVLKFSKLAAVSRQQIYKDLSAKPAKLLALTVGKGGQRLPEWQLEERPLELTRIVMQSAPELDAWTVYHALSTPSGAFEDCAPVAAVKQQNRTVKSVASVVLEELGVHAAGA